MKLRFKISSCSSQNPLLPSSNLASTKQQWQSARFCTYPQQLTLMLYQPATINRIKITSHPSKVPQKISLLYHLPTVQNQQEFTKIGFVRFREPKQEKQQSQGNGDVVNTKPKTNTKKLKQAKVIGNLQIKAQYIRLIISENYKLKSNFFNQVSLSSVQLQGESSPMELSQLKIKNDSMVQLDNFFASKLSILAQFKQKCIANEQYEQAKQIKLIIEQVNDLILEIKQLNEQKIELIHQQQYIEAKQVKQQIMKIRQKIQYVTNNFYDPKKKMVNRFQGVLERSRKKKVSLQSRINVGQKTTQQDHLSTNQFLNDETNQKEEQNNHELQNMSQSFVLSHQQQVVPALLNKLKGSKPSLPQETVAQQKQTQQQQNDSKNELPAQPEELSPSNEANSSLLQEFYDKIVIRKLYSKYWQFRQQALQLILQDSKKNANSLITKNRLRAYLFVYNRVMSKQNNKLFLLSVIQMINLVTNMKVQEKDFKQEMSRQLEKALIQTLEKTQGQNPKVKMQAEKVIIRMTESTIFGMGLVYHAVVKNYDDKLSSRLKKIYLDTLEYMVSNAQPAVIKKEIPGLIVDFAVKKLTDPSNEVRKSAINLLKSLKKQGYEDRIKVCMNEEKSFKESYLKELGIE